MNIPKKIPNLFTFISVLFLSLSINGHAQDEKWCEGISLHFCEKVDDKGNMTKEAFSFTLPKGGGNVTAVVFAEKGKTVGAESLLFQVCKEGEKSGVQRKEVCVAPLEQHTQTNLVWTYKEIFFSEPGAYSISVYPKDYSWTCMAKITISIK